MDLPFGIEMIDLITVVAGLAVFFTVFAIWSALIRRDPMRGRIKVLQERRNELRDELVQTNKRTSHIKTLDHIGLMRRIIDKFKLLKDEKKQSTVLLLAQAGYRHADALTVYIFAKLLMPILAVLVVLFLIFIKEMFAGELLSQGLLAIGVFALGLYAPKIFIKNATDKRYDEIRKALPDALDLMVICAEAGLTLDAALNRVSKEMANASPELADELSLTAIELGFLTERRKALNNLSDRVNLKTIRSVVATLIQTERYGTPLSQSLRVLSNEFREIRMMEAEEKAARLPAIMTIPLILFILPVLFIVLLGPATCSVADNLINRGM
ncbi:MAG: type II secretion system F family protein [Sphingomonadales bacterium]|nr:type II secretion system F family protein [Sphingomonadales bacterium]